MQRPFTKRLDTRRLKIISRDTEKTLCEGATGVAQFGYEGLWFAKKLGQK